MLKNYLTLLAIGLIWGSQFIFQQQAILDFSPILIGTCRALLGALTLIAICKLLNIKGSNKQWGLFALIGLLEAVIPFVQVPWGQRNLTSSVTAILMGTLPFYALILAPVFIKNAKITVGNSFSVIVGFSGLLVLFYPEFSTQNSTIDLISAAAIIAATVCFAVALLLLNRVKNEHPLIVARNVLSMASIQLIFIALSSKSLDIDQPSASSIFSLIYLGIMCAGAVYYLYMLSIKRAGAVFTSMTNYLVPAVGVVIGVYLSNESVELTTWIALLIILSPLFINQIFSRNEPVN